MNVEIQVALNFIISYLFNKLPRRRVNMFGEELDKAIRNKFAGHWYPDKPAKGSAYRCLRVAGPPDPVLSEATRQSGLELSDVLELLPAELNIWIDPGEVSYRISEKSMVKILYSARDENENPDQEVARTFNADRGVARTFNPEAEVFKPVMDQLNNSLNKLTLDTSSSPFPSTNSPSPTQFNSTSPTPTPFVHKSAHNMTFTTATFAQTKFGSTKLKSNGRRPNRLSPTELSHFIKQRTVIQHPMFGSNPQGLRSRSISPNPSFPPPPPGMEQFLLMQAKLQAQQNSAQAQYNTAFVAASRALQDSAFSNNSAYSNNSLSPGLFDSSGMRMSEQKPFGDGADFNLNALPYLNQFQHLLVAN